MKPTKKAPKAKTLDAGPIIERGNAMSLYHERMVALIVGEVGGISVLVWGFLVAEVM